MLADITGEVLLKTTFMHTHYMPGFAVHRHRSHNLVLQLDYNFNVKICTARRYNPVNTRRRPDAGLMTARQR